MADRPKQDSGRRGGRGCAKPAKQASAVAGPGYWLAADTLRPGNDRLHLATTTKLQLYGRTPTACQLRPPAGHTSPVPSLEQSLILKRLTLTAA